MKIDGACLCGFIKIEAEADPETTTICHCTDCQSGTGSAFRVSIPVRGATFKMTGQPTTYLKTTADSGNPRVLAFCPKCGSPIYSTSPGDGVQAVLHGAGRNLAPARSLVPRQQIWFRSARPWVAEIAAIPAEEQLSALRYPEAAKRERRLPNGGLG